MTRDQQIDACALCVMWVIILVTLVWINTRVRGNDFPGETKYVITYTDIRDEYHSEYVQMVQHSERFK